MCEPVHLRGDLPTRSLRPASSQTLTSSSVPACCQRGLKDYMATRPGPWRWLQDGELTSALSTSWDVFTPNSVFDERIDFPSLSVLLFFPCHTPIHSPGCQLST